MRRRALRSAAWKCEQIAEDFGDIGIDAMIATVLKHKRGWEFEIDQSAVKAAEQID